MSPTNALPDYPRPQLARSQWRNLNGAWEFAAGTAGENPPVGQSLGERILVPYPVESALSGIMRHEGPEPAGRQHERLQLLRLRRRQR